jgi:hypothetical protein
MTPEEIQVLRDYYDNTCTADLIEQSELVDDDQEV